jgi:regulatory protein
MPDGAKTPAKPLKPIFEVALAMVARREHTVTEVKRKLRTKGYLPNEISDVVATLQAKNYLNDERAAAMMVRRRALGSKWGAGRITQELAAKGIEKEVAKNRLATFTEGEEGLDGHDWQEAATKLLRAKYKTPLPADRTERQKERAKRLGFLQRRGFSAGQAYKAYEAAFGLGSLEETE